MIILYHGTSIKNAKKIMKNGFKDKGNRKGNWGKGKFSSKKGFVYLTLAYPFFYGNNTANENDKKAMIIRVEVNEKDLYPDEDFLIQGSKGRLQNPNIENYKHLGKDSLKYMGNVAIKPNKIKVLDMKEYEIIEMAMWADPSISIMNFRILGSYYTELVDNWYKDQKWRISISKYLKNLS